MRTEEETNAEIIALKSLIPVGEFKERTKRGIAVAIEQIQYPWDTKSMEFEELPAEEQMIILDTLSWQRGSTDKRPSAWWSGLVKKEGK